MEKKKELKILEALNENSPLGYTDYFSDCLQEIKELGERGIIVVTGESFTNKFISIAKGKAFYTEYNKITAVN